MTSNNTFDSNDNGQAVVDIPLISGNLEKQNLNQFNSSSNNSRPNSFQTPNQINQRIKEAKDAFATGKSKDVKFRKTQLKRLVRLVRENEQLICDAIKADLNKVSKFLLLTDIHSTVNLTPNFNSAELRD